LDEEMSTIEVLLKAAKISSLNESSDWSEWNRKLKKQLEMIDLWKILIDEIPESLVSDEKHIIWVEKQEQLKALLSLILDTASRSLIEASSVKNVTKQYKLLKAEYNKISISTYALLYRRIFRCSLINHKSLQKYADEIINARNKLTDLSRSLDELAITCAFLNELDNSYQNWKEMWINSQDIYTKDNKKDLKIQIVENLVIKLLDRKTSKKAFTSKDQKDKAFVTKKGN
jgi:hypothetical protein